MDAPEELLVLCLRIMTARCRGTGILTCTSTPSIFFRLLLLGIGGVRCLVQYLVLGAETQSSHQVKMPSLLIRVRAAHINKNTYNQKLAPPKRRMSSERGARWHVVYLGSRPPDLQPRGLEKPEEGLLLHVAWVYQRIGLLSGSPRRARNAGTHTRRERMRNRKKVWRLRGDSCHIQP